MITFYVNTASLAGGDGTTNSTTGANRAYSTLSWAIFQLSGQNYADDVEILCCGPNEDSAFVEIRQNNYMQAGYSLYIRANRNDPSGYHGGRYNPKSYRIRRAAISIQIYNNFANKLVIDGIQLIHHTSSSDTIFWCNRPLPVGSQIIDCIFVNETQQNYATYLAHAALTLDILDCTFVSLATPTLCINGVWCNNGTVNVRNCVAYGYDNGFFADSPSAVMNVKNCEAFGNGDDFHAAMGGTLNVDYCASDDGDGTNPIAVPSWPSQFANPNYIAACDFRIKRSSVLWMAGVGPIVDPLVPVRDIVGQPRQGTSASVGPFAQASDWASQLDYRFLRTNASYGLQDALDASHSIQVVP